MTLTRARTLQYIGILLSLGIIAVGYWYFSARAGVKTNTSALQPQGVGDLSAGLAGYWKLDEGSGTTAADSSTNGNNGTFVNTPSWTTGRINQGLTNFSTTAYVNVPHSAALNSLPFTLSFWVKTADASSGRHIVIAKDYTNGYRCHVVSGAMRCWFLTSGANWYDSGDGYSFGQIADNQWHHITMTISASGGVGYVDGVQVVSQSLTGTPAVAPTGTGDLSIGTGSGGNPVDDFSGSLDEVRIYNRTLSSDEVSNLYRLTSPTGVDTSLKGYWSFNTDALSGTTAYDWSGAGNNGTLTNGPVVAEGRVGQGLSFDGNNDDTTIPDSVSLSPTTALTYSFWAKRTDTVATDGTFIAKSDGGGGRRGTAVVSSSGGGITFHTATDSNSDFSSSTLAGGLVQQNQWVYIVAVFDGSGVTNTDRAKVYVNGTQQALSFGGTVPSSIPDTVAPLTMGGNFTYPYFPGILDEVRFYNRALTAAEIKSLYDRGAPDKGNTSALQSAGNGRLESGLAGYWKLDETTGSSAADASTNANTGTLSNMENGDWIAGQIGNGLDFDGTNEYVSASATPFVSHSSGTITAWIKSTNGSAAQTIFGISTLASSNYAGYFHTNANGKLAIRIKGNGSDLVNCGVTDSGSAAQVAASGTWTFVAITNDPTGKKFYKNAYQQGHDCGSDTTWFDDLSAQAPADVSLGAWLVAGGSQTLFQGSLDEVRVYDHALSQDEIANLYRVTTPTAVDTGLKGYWSFNGQDMSGTTAYDRSGKGANGTLTGGPATVEGKVGQALLLDGSNDRMSTTVLPSSLFTDATTTVAGWFKTSGLDKDFLSQDSCSGGWRINIGDTGFINAELKGSGSCGATVATRRSNITGLNDNSWHHFAVIMTTVTSGSNNNIDIYVDGVLNEQSLSSTASYSTASDNTLHLGARYGGYNYFPGTIDEIRIYNRALSAAEIKAQYDAANPDKSNTSISQPQGSGRLDSGLVGYWKLDDASGTTATDASTNSNSGTLSGGPTWVTGQIGGAIDLDGTNDYGTVPYISALSATTNITYSVWLKPDLNEVGGIFGAINGEDGSAYNFMTIDNNGAEAGNPSIVLTRNIGGTTSSRSVQFSYPVSTWFHLTYTYDGAYERMYINGARLGEWSQTGNFASNSEFGLVVGLRHSLDSNFFNGAMDEIRIYNRTLSSDEVSQLYRLGTPTGTDTNLTGYWSFNGGDMNGTTAYDRSGRSVNGTLTNGASITEGKLGQGISFDGTNDYIALGNHTAEQTVYTIAFWVYQTGSVSGNPFTRGDSGACFYNPRFDMDGTSITYAESGCSGTGIVGSAPLSVGWHHVVGTRNGGTSKLYVDGELIPTTGASAGFLGDGSTGKGSIGASWQNNSTFGGYLNTKMDEVRVYNREFSANEVKALYNLSK